MKPEVLTPDVEVLDLDEQISTALVKHNITEAIINSLKKQYGGLKLRSIDDKESYLELKAARKEVRKWGILTEDITKKGRENAIAIQKKWLAKEKEILGKIAEVQDPLDAEIKRFDDEVARKDAEEKKRQEEAYMQRSQVLSKMGALYQGSNFVLNDVSFEASLLKEADSDTWESVILPKFLREYQKIESKRIEEERIKAEKEAELEKQRKDFEEQQRLFKEQQDAFKKQQEDAEKNRLELERLEREKNTAAQRQQEQAQLALQQKRMQIIAPYNPYNKGIEVTELWNMSEEHFVSLVADTKEKYEVEQAEKQRQIEEKAAEAERLRIAEQQRLDEVKKQQEIQRQAEEMEQSNDKFKFLDILEQFKQIKIHEMKSPIYRKKVQIIREKVEEIILL